MGDLRFAFEDALACCVVQVGDFAGFVTVAYLHLGQAVAGVIAEGAQAVTGQVACGVQAAVDLGAGGAGDGLAFAIEPLGGVDLAPAQEAVAVVGDSECLGAGSLQVGCIEVAIQIRVAGGGVCGADAVHSVDGAAGGPDDGAVGMNAPATEFVAACAMTTVASWQFDRYFCYAGYLGEYARS